MKNLSSISLMSAFYCIYGVICLLSGVLMNSPAELRGGQQRAPSLSVWRHSRVSGGGNNNMKTKNTNAKTVSSLLKLKVFLIYVFYLTVF